MYSSIAELSLEIFSQHVCLLFYRPHIPNPGELLDHIALSHLLHWPALLTPAPPAEIEEDRTRLGRTQQRGQDGGNRIGSGGFYISESERYTSVLPHPASGQFSVFHVFHRLLHRFIITFSFGFTHTLHAITESLSGTDNVTQPSLFHYDQLSCSRGSH